MLTDNEIASIIKSEERDALDYEGELAKKREKLLDYYNLQPYGDEVDGQSQAVTSDVSDVIEWMLPSLIRIFTQGKLIAKFEADTPQYDDEADQKTFLSNYCFTRENNGTLTLHNMFKDALLQYTGTVKVVWEESEQVRKTHYTGLSEQEYAALVSDKGVEIDDFEEYETEHGKQYDVRVSVKSTVGNVRYYNIPPEEFLVSRAARDFECPRFIGHRSPKTRSQLIAMGFDEDIVNSLPAYDEMQSIGQKNARYHDFSDYFENNPSNHKPNDTIYLGEYYIELDQDGDGITELHKVFFAGDKVLESEQVEDHPFAVCVPIPIPHRAIGSCPAEQVAPIQFRKSVLVRNMLDNIYMTNYPRVLYSNKVDLDDLLTPRAGGGVEVDTDAPDVAGHAQPFVIPTMIDSVMKAIEYTDMEREVRTGVTRYSQGLDAESLNKTATGFKGIMDASQQRIDLIARLFADGGVKQIFLKTIDLLSKHQDTAKQIKVLGEVLEIHPRDWGNNTKCRIDIGLGSGDRQEKIANLNNILNMQSLFMDKQLVLADQTKMYNTLEKIVDEVGLKEVSEYFNNPEVEEETLFAQNQQLVQMVQQLKAQAENPFVQPEMIRAQAQMLAEQNKRDIETAKIEQKGQESQAKQAFDQQQFIADMAARLTELELKYNQDVPGSTV